MQTELSFVVIFEWHDKIHRARIGGSRGNPKSSSFDSLLSVLFHEAIPQCMVIKK